MVIDHPDACDRAQIKLFDVNVGFVPNNAYVFVFVEQSYTTDAVTADSEPIIIADEEVTVVPAGTTLLEVASTAGFAAGQSLYIQDAAEISDSQWVMCRKIDTDASITLVDGLLHLQL